MCIIAVKEKGLNMFDDKTIKQMFKRNSDGAGIMWAENGTVYFKKGFMKVEPFLDFVHARTDWKNIPAVLHFRIGTAGGNTPLNCHPYPVNQKNSTEGTCDMAMAHNGVMYKYNPPVGSTINDTQVFVNTIINEMPVGFLKNKAIMKLIKNDIGTNKLAFLDKSGEITLIGDFIEENGYKFSNSSFRAITPVYAPTPTYTGHPWKSWCNKFEPTPEEEADILEDEELLNRDLELDEEEEWGNELSFESKFTYCGEGVAKAEFNSLKEYNEAIEELESRAIYVDEGIYETVYDTYELDDGTIYRFSNAY